MAQMICSSMAPAEFSRFKLNRHEKFVEELFRSRPTAMIGVSRCDVNMACELLLHRLAFTAQSLYVSLVASEAGVRSNGNPIPFLLSMQVSNTGHFFIGAQETLAERLADRCRDIPNVRNAVQASLFTSGLVSFPDPLGEELGQVRGQYDVGVLSRLSRFNVPGQCAEDRATITAIRYEPNADLPITLTVILRHRRQSILSVDTIPQCVKCHNIDIARNAILDYIPFDPAVAKVNYNEVTGMMMLTHPGSVGTMFQSVLNKVVTEALHRPDVGVIQLPHQYLTHFPAEGFGEDSTPFDQVCPRCAKVVDRQYA
uniref:Uncharacterized protein n=1 Tax=Spongospora subterranea TaxID=70186 RepID=A0A0H5QVG7_9EUKA|eukprot:CRZ05981.1 hypothetical protein [Spongospora subterranea]